jgi:hypothetical protein
MRMHYGKAVNHLWGRVVLLVVPGCLCPSITRGQIDPANRELIQIGYNAALEGQSPLAAYAFYYWNRPNFLQHTNLTLRLAVAPTYLDSELGFKSLLGEYTDVGVGIAGGGFADDYYEIRQGTYRPGESFSGYGAEVDGSIYHLFNPGQKIPLNGLLRTGVRYSTYAPTSDTSPRFEVPPDRETLFVRAGLRWGGKEPVLFPPLAMEVSIWYEGQFRTSAGNYGFGDFTVEPHSHLFWGEALISYTFPKSKQNLYINITAGTSLDADRFSAYRLGALLPLVSEFPLSLPGYYYQEISARQFVLFGATYIVPLDRRQRWNLAFSGATAWVDYLPGQQQPGNWNSGLAGGLLYQSPSWKFLVGYGYGVDAIRSHGRGANSIGVLVQFDLGRFKGELLTSEPPGRWGGFQHMFDIFGL